ncbi:mechanosensitive ion channel family protein [Virgibacillus dokdonensis]|uniref:Low conductance mechanosensitive channel YnaI n=1 Tax=Virgibacillus dokdonensis TaxID=302167 RepID=A0A2K9IVW3_9BACI|nr:mechanosensitive ion channel family protein [Virgibacillus dokdonensis]AUJ23892.1 Low conductance mechanosensitive channel YnaI [Virgibacillus dokdonensis]
MLWDILQAYEKIIHSSISIIVLLTFFFLRKRATRYLFALLLKISNHTLNGIFVQLRASFERPIQGLILIMGIYIAVILFPYVHHTNTLFLQVIRSAIIFIFGWGLFHLSSSSSLLFAKLNEKFQFNIDSILIPFLSKAVRLIIVAICFSIIAQEFGYDINGFVAGLGIGGLAFALAAKDALANFFGGIIIITEKPFTIDDWILTPSVEGTVEDISFRSTKIRTFAQALVTVPNATLANESITNWSKMEKRQITFNLRVTYDTPRDRMENVIAQIRKKLLANEAIHKETIFVHFDQYQENGLDIFLYFFTNTTDWGAYLQVREEVNLMILDILEKEQVTIALPTRKLFVTNEADNFLTHVREGEEG